VTKAGVDLEKGSTLDGPCIFRANPVPSGNDLCIIMWIIRVRRISLERFVKSRLRRWNCAKTGTVARLGPWYAFEVGVIDTVPMGVDTPEDLERQRKYWRAK